MSETPVIVRHTDGDRPAAGHVRIAACQYGVTTEVEDNLATALRMIDLAAAEQPDVIMTPEFVNHVSWYDNRDQAWERAITLDGPWIEQIGAKAREHNVWILINGIVRRDNGRLTGTNIMFNPQGEIAGQSSKQVLMGSERLHFDAGNEITPLVDTPFGRTGMYSCMDGVIAETPRSLAVRGARVLLNTLNSFAPDEASLHVPVRAAENKVWVISANKVDYLVNEGPRNAVAEALKCPVETLLGAGESMVVDPSGTVVAQAPRRGEAVLVVDIDPSLGDDKRRPDGTDVMAARRPDVYAPIANSPVGRQAGAGAEELLSAVVQPAADGAAAIAEAATAVADAVTKGAQLIVLPELFCFADGLLGDLSSEEAAARADAAIEALTGALAGSDAVVVTSLPRGNAHAGVVIAAEGVIGEQKQIHAIARHSAWVSDLGDDIAIVERSWGRLAVLVGDDSIFPEAFRLTALRDADVVAVPLDVQEKWEVTTGLKERAAENRVNIVAASRPRTAGASYVVPLTSDFGMWRSERAKTFDGVISCPDAVEIAPTPGTTVVAVHPAEAINRIVTRETDLVDGRPWALLEPLVTAQA